MALYMESTKIPAIKTAAEIEELLIDAGATNINKVIGPNRQITAMRWTMAVDGAQIPFAMPIRIEPVFRWLQSQRAPKFREKMREADAEQAERVAWRQLLRWIQAQVAFIECGMVQGAEAFMPYMIGKSGHTMWETAVKGGLKQLTGGGA